MKVSQPSHSDSSSSSGGKSASEFISRPLLFFYDNYVVKLSQNLLTSFDIL